ncbi:Isopenicillin N synthase-like, Fe(2+) 2OG dioxygenase domain [Dillenia turbinata]|uniref:Isopenicillin N synthase-like, Fe(2+) 2OG dioxygenase domain n=1 Tax=Dillenia turbinata TaxID=194707 RepID=A0AAN8ZJE2_9MAGN
MEVERVQSIASIAKITDTIPIEYVRSEKEQPCTTTVVGKDLEVPVIDFGSSDEKGLVKAIAEASQDWGLFQIVNHDIPTDVIKKLQEVGKQFFELPPEEKEKYAKPEGSTSVEGYGTKLQKEIEGKKGWVDHIFHKIWPPLYINYRFWPQNPPSYRAANEEYAKCLHEVVNKLMGYLGKGLGLEEGELKTSVGGDDLVYLLKINYYPPCPRPDLALGVVAHTDMCALTILVPNEVQGLQVCRDERWYDVKYIPNALIIHIGDQLEIVSNGKYKAVLHRSTVTKDKTRMSWPVFLEPPSDFAVGPHPMLVSDENQAKFKTKKYSDYVYCKLNKIPQ